MESVSWFQNLLTLSPDDLGILRQRVTRSLGRVRIFVHPFFEYHNPSNFHRQDPAKFLAQNPRVEAISQACLRIAGMGKAPPLIIFEEERHLIKTRDWLAPHVKGNQLYYVPTLDNRGIPKTEPFGERADYPETYWELEYTWGMLLDPLLAAGVVSVIVGGIELIILHEKDRETKPRDIQDYRARRRSQGVQYLSYDIVNCVATVIKEMARHFKTVQISCLAHPHSYGDIRRVEEGGPSTRLYPTTAQRQSRVV